MEISRDPRAYAKDVFWIIQFDFFPSYLLSFEFLFTTTEIIKHRELTSNISQEASNVVIILQNISTKIRIITTTSNFYKICSNQNEEYSSS